MCSEGIPTIFTLCNRPYDSGVPRWTEDARGRLQRAALELFMERGYEQVTVAQIAERAGLTRRSFFNHFTDKREIFFAGADAFQAHVVACMTAAPSGLDPFEAATAALASAGEEIAKMAGDAAGPVRALIEASAELRERDLAKMLAVTCAMADTLVDRGATARVADLTARAAVMAFTVAFQDWTNHPERDLAALMHTASVDLRRVISVATTQ